MIAGWLHINIGIFYILNGENFLRGIIFICTGCVFFIINPLIIWKKTVPTIGTIISIIISGIAFIYGNEMLFNPELTIEPYCINYPRIYTKDECTKYKITDGSYLTKIIFKIRKRGWCPAKDIECEIYIKYGKERHFLASWYPKPIPPAIQLNMGRWKEEAEIKVQFPVRPEEKEALDQMPLILNESNKLTIIVTTHYRTWLKIRDINTFEKYKYIRNAEKGKKQFVRIQ